MRRCDWRILTPWSDSSSRGCMAFVLPMDLAEGGLRADSGRAPSLHRRFNAHVVSTQFCAAHAFVRAQPCRAQGEFKTCADCPLWARPVLRTTIAAGRRDRRSRRGSQRSTGASMRSGPGWRRFRPALRPASADADRRTSALCRRLVILNSEPTPDRAAAIERVLARRSAFTRGVAGVNRERRRWPPTSSWRSLSAVGRRLQSYRIERLSPASGQRRATFVVLNKADVNETASAEPRKWEGVAGVPVLATSARLLEGVAALRACIHEGETRLSSARPASANRR